MQPFCHIFGAKLQHFFDITRKNRYNGLCNYLIDLFFSPGMAVTDLVLRMLSLMTGLTLSELRYSSSLTEEQRSKLNNCINKIHEAPLYLDDTDSVDIQRLRAKCRRMRMDQHICMVIIDGLWFVATPGEWGGSHGSEENAEMTARHLKSLSKELDTPVLVTEQLSSRVENHSIDIPYLSELKELDAISGYADNVFAINGSCMKGGVKVKKADKVMNRTALYMLKHNSGDIGTVNINYHEGFELFPETK